MQERWGRFRAIMCTEEQNPSVVDDLYRFRKGLFVDRLGWELTVEDGRERDQFDTDAAVHCALFEGRQVIGGFRAIRTDHDYLAQTVFPYLASLKPYPRQRNAWEISRFGVSPGGGVRPALLNYALMFRFAHTRQAAILVAVANLQHERLLARFGVRTRRYGPPQVVGETEDGSPMLAVAGEIPVREQTGPRFSSLLEFAKDVEIDDEALVLGPARVSA